MNVMGYYDGKDIVRDYVCAACWGSLDYRQHDKTNPHIVNVFCVRCKDATPGFVSRRYVEYQIRENEQQLLLAKQALKYALPWIRKIGEKV